MNSAFDISWARLLISQGIILLPIVLFWYYKAPLIRSTLIAVSRMIGQLFLVGLYLEYVFKLNSTFVNITWVLIMIVIASITTSKRSGLNTRYFAGPLCIALLISMILVDALFLGFAIDLNNLFEARYFIPITGMILGNIIKSIVVGMRYFYQQLSKHSLQYKYALASGASFNEAILPYLRSTFVISFNPMIATMAIIGLIALPGMMTGQILGGSSPAMAVKYQIMLMLAVFVSNVLAVYLSIVISNIFVFDKFLNLKQNVLKK